MSRRPGRARKNPAPRPRIQVDPEAPLVLALDSSGPVEAMALAQGDLVLAQWSCRRTRRGGAALPSVVTSLLESVNRKAADLSAVVAVTGPGSFTGLRVGIATALGLAEGLGVPTFAASSLPAWAAGVGPARLPVAVTLDARRQEVYTALYDLGVDGSPTPRLEMTLESPERWFERLRELDTPVLLVGDGALLYRPVAEATLGDRAQFTGAVPCGPAVGWLARRGVERVLRGDSQGDPLTPIYLREHDGARSAASPAASASLQS